MLKKIIFISTLAVIFSAWPALVTESRPPIPTIAEGQTCGGGSGNSNTNQPPPPAQVTSPNPANGSINIPVNQQLSWAPL